jgi:signal transduction histidine kinase/ligand-binding sensor domain-containing protein
MSAIFCRQASVLPSRAASLLCALLIAACPLPAAAAEWDDLLTGYSLTSWHDEAGRALGSVYGIAQDADGYLWIAADAGLLRFDGSRFTAWSRFGELHVPTASARSLFVARDTSLWVGFSRREGVGRIKDGTLTRYREGLDGIDAVTDLVEDARGVMWAVGDRTLFKLEGRAWRRIRLPWRSIEGQVYHPYVARNGQMWISTRWGVFRREGDSDTFHRVSDDLVWGLGEDAEGQIWTTDIATGFRQLGETPPSHPLQGGGYRLIHDRHNHLWLSTFGAGLWRVTREGGAFTVRRAVTRTGLSSDSVQAIFEDRDGNLWVGTTGGLHRLTRRRLTPIDDIGAVLATAPARGGGLWVGTASGLMRRDLAADARQPMRVGRSAPDIRNFHTDRHGVLWMGTGDGLWTFDGQRLDKVRIPERPQMLVRWLAPDRRGGFWLADGDWLYRWDGAHLSALPAPASVAARSRIRFAGGDSSGRVWVGLTAGQLGFVDDDGTFHRVGAGEGLPDGTHASINAIFEDRDRTVWIGGTGLSRYVNGRLTTLTHANGLPDGRVWAIVDDEPGNLWLSMDRGLVRLARGELQKAVADPTYRVQYQAYDARDGVAGSAVGIINATRAADGSLWFAQGGGLTHADPLRLTTEPDSAPPRPRIAAVVANETPALLAVRPSFAAGTRRLEIHYAAPTLTGSNNVRFRYRLDGVDSNWVDAGTERTAIYTNLGAGQYRFRVASTIEGGGNSSQDEVWAFRIQPLFYETGWFYALVTAAVAFALWGAWRARLRLVEQRFSLVLAERARLSREIHDTLLQSLVGVALQVDVVSSGLDPSASSARHQLVRIRRQVEQYIRDARQSILDLRSPHLESRDLATALREFGRTAIGTSRIRLTVTKKGAETECPPKVENQLLRVGQEAITNAVRHAGASRIRVDLECHAHSVVLSVSDDGRGFDYERMLHNGNGHYGLRTMRERAEELGGRFSVASADGRGTTVTAVVPTTVVAREELLAEL